MEKLERDSQNRLVEQLGRAPVVPPSDRLRKRLEARAVWNTTSDAGQPAGGAVGPWLVGLATLALLLMLVVTMSWPPSPAASPASTVRPFHTDSRVASNSLIMPVPVAMRGPTPADEFGVDLGGLTRSPLVALQLARQPEFGESFKETGSAWPVDPQVNRSKSDG